MVFGFGPFDGRGLPVGLGLGGPGIIRVDEEHFKNPDGIIDMVGGDEQAPSPLLRAGEHAQGFGVDEAALVVPRFGW